ncbi:MAG: DtxR family transcriptional regulator [Clostridiaceae bacterium]|jgi:DtxR family Mn-dependent transcriptional regulator|nr:DtxR family transcriptional regulator [Clostridiaceae bacterium]
MQNNNKFHTVRGYQLLEQNKRILTSAMEDYLEMIYRYSLTDDQVRINTISELLNVQASSVTKMVQKLSELGMVDYKKYGILSLTDIGKEIGHFLLHRHQIIESFLKLIGVSDSLLIETELMEHTISVDTLNRLHALTLLFEQHPNLIDEYDKILQQ